jgi:non-specific serine/threonine protein kinase
MRYRLLETVRQYGDERLQTLEEAEPTRRRHAEYLVDHMATLSEERLRHLDRWVELVRPERDNLRAALAWSRDASEPELLIRHASSVWRFWWIRGEISEGSSWLETALDRSAELELEPALVARTLEGASGLAWAAGDMPRAERLAAESRPLFAGDGDRRGEVAALIVLGHIALARDDFAAAESIFLRTRDLSDGLSPVFVALAFHNLGSVAFGLRDLELAATRYEDALEIYRGESDEYGVALSELYLGLVDAERDQSDAAAEHLARALPVFREMGFLQYSSQCVDGSGVVALGRGRPEDGAHLLAAASGMRARTGGSPTVATRLIDAATGAARASLGDAAFEQAWAAGAGLADDEAFELADRVLAG